MTGGRKLKIRPGLFATTMIILLVYPALQAQACGEWYGRNNYLVQGSWSLQFRIENDFTLGSFEGALISAKRHLSPATAVRFGVGMNGSVSDNNLYDYRENIDSTGLEILEYDRDGNSENIDFSFVSQLLFYTNPQSSINFYFGVGPKVTYNRVTDEYEYDRKLEDPSNRNRYDVYDSYSRTWGIGLLGSWGVEIFMTRKISFLCEYGAGMEYQSQISNHSSSGSSDDMESNRMSDSESKTFRFYSNRVNFGLSVYFN